MLDPHQIESSPNESERKDQMLNSPRKEKEHRQDVWERLDNLLVELERHRHALLDMNDIELMNPFEREQLAIRSIALLLKACELRMKYADQSDMDDDQAIIDALYGRFPKQETNEGNQ